MGTEAIAVLGVAVSALAIFYLAVFGQNSLADHIRAARVRKEILRTKRIESTAADRVMANLPTPEYIEFVGRNDEVARLESILRPYPHSQHSVVAIDGLGGAGKSALALYVAIRAVERAASEQPPDRFAAVIWISAKERLISATGTYTRKRQERTLEDIFETIAICLGRQDITRAPTETQVELVRSALAAQRTLLVFDNMETIDDENVYAFLRELPAPTKAIVTSRMQLDVAYSIHLDGLNPDAAARVFRTQAGSAATSPDSRLNTLIDRSEGLPLVMVWSAARMRLGDTLDDVLKRIEGRRGEALVEYSFGGIWANMMLDEDLRHVLIAAACLPSPASSEIVAEACDMSNDEARKHLLELSRSRLVSRADDQWRLQSLVRACTLRESSADEHAQLLARASRALVERLRSIVGDERVSAISATQYGLIDRDRDNVVYLIDWNASRGAWDIVRGLVGGLGYYLHARGLWANAVRTWEVGALAAQQLDDPRYEARFRTYLGYMAYFMGHPERAAAYAQEASKLVEGGDDVYQIASVLRLHG